MFETTYDGPTTTTSMRFGDRTIQIVRPAEPDRLLNDAAVLDLNRRDDYMPYWAYLWPGAYLLAEVVAREAWVPGTRALEIGCGLGLAGLVGVASGLTLHFTDYDECPLRFVDRSARASGFEPGRVTTARLDWRHPPTDRFPVILGADVLYERRLVPLVCDVISAMLERGGVALVAGPYRVATEELEACLSTRGLIAEAERVSATPEEIPAVSGTLHRIRHRA
ncbi:MAG: putative methyltransferase [Planctomycetota bacterium]|nr:putative methyltransferase [Planctomycetota bacterium]